MLPGRKRNRPKRYAEEQVPTKKQCVIQFARNNESVGKCREVPKPKAKLPSKRKAKQTKIPPLSFLVEPKPTKCEIPYESKSFNEIIQSKAGESKAVHIHPFFSATREVKRSGIQKSSSVSCVRDRQLFGIDKAMPPIHIQQLSCDPSFPPMENLNLFSTTIETAELSEDYGELELPDIFNIQALLHRLDVDIQEYDDPSEVEIPLIPLEAYVEELKMIQDQLLRRYPLSCSHLFLSEEELKLLFQSVYLSRNSSSDRNGDTLLWTERYKPLHTADYFSSPIAGNQLYAWLYSWKQYISENGEQSSQMNEAQQELRSYKGFLLHSDAPLGKSSLIYCLARQMDMKVVEVNGSDLRNTRLIKSLEEATQSHHLSLRDSSTVSTGEGHKLLLFEDVDVRNEDESSFYSTLLSLLANTKQPIVMTCSYIPEELLSSVPLLTHDISQYNPLIRKFSLERHLLMICLAELHSFPSIDSLLELCYYFWHDQRKILHCLQFWNRINTRTANKQIDNWLQLILGIPLSLPDTREQLPHFICDSNFDIFRDTKLFNSFPLDNYCKADVALNKHQQFVQMQQISEAYDSFGVSDLFCAGITDDDIFPYDNYSFHMQRQTDFRLKPDDSLHTFSKDYLPQVDSLTEQISLASRAFSYVHYIPSLSQTPFQVDFPSILHHRNGQDNKRKCQKFLHLLRPYKSVSTRTERLDIISHLQLICSLENTRKTQNTKRRFLHHLSTSLPAEICTQVVKTSIVDY